ncbi:MAG: FAD:protein FMN transferase [Kiritimatiellia bacterium]
MSLHRNRFFVPFLIAGLLFAGCGSESGKPVTVSFMGMGTLGSLVVPPADAARAPEMLAQASTLVGELENKLSLFKPESDLSRLHAQAGEAVEVSPDTLAVVTMSLQASRNTGGAFDLTVGPLMTLWGFRGSNAAHRVPTEAERRAVMESVGYEHVSVSGRTVRLDGPGIRLDAGGIGKGYAVDRCWEALKRSGHGRFLMNLGGNMRAAGRPAGNRPWTVGVRHPFQADAILGKMRLEDGMAVATSGHYERFVTLDGVRYAHIMDPRTGLPVRGMAGVTVVASTAAEADVLSTALFILGPEMGMALLAQMGSRAEALFVPDRQPLEIQATPGLAALFEPLPGMTVQVLRRHDD